MILLYSIINYKNILRFLCLKPVTVACFIFSPDNYISKVSKQYKNRQSGIYKLLITQVGLG